MLKSRLPPSAALEEPQPAGRVEARGVARLPHLVVIKVKMMVKMVLGMRVLLMPTVNTEEAAE